jgi:hypothetical protein
VSGAETARWRSSWAAAAEAQWAAARAGKFKESAAQFLISSWQGDALSVSRRTACISQTTARSLRPHAALHQPSNQAPSTTDGQSHLLLTACSCCTQSVARSWSEGDPCQEPTGLPLTTLQRVGQAICKVPPGFNAHPEVRHSLACRQSVQPTTANPMRACAAHASRPNAYVCC